MMNKKYKVFMMALTLAFCGNTATMAQDKYDKVLEDCYRIAGETGIGAPDMQGAVDRIRKWKIEMPPAERLKSAKNKLERIRKEMYGPRTEIAPKGGRKSSAPTVGKPKTQVKYPTGSANGNPRYIGPSKAKQEIDNNRKQAAIDGAKDVHNKTKESYDKTQNEILKGQKFAAGFDSSKYDTSHLGGNADGTGYVEPQRLTALDGVDLMAGLEDEPKKEYNVDELIVRFQKDEHGLTCDELDYLYDYVQAHIDEIESKKKENNKGDEY